jgi:hypothetical protein
MDKTLCPTFVKGDKSLFAPRIADISAPTGAHLIQKQICADARNVTISAISVSRSGALCYALLFRK